MTLGKSGLIIAMNDSEPTNFVTGEKKTKREKRLDAVLPWLLIPSLFIVIPVGLAASSLFIVLIISYFFGLM